MTDMEQTTGTLEQPGSKSSMMLSIPTLKIVRAEVEIIGTSPLVMHRMSEKNKKMLKESGQKVKGKTKSREFPDPEEEYKESMYTLNDGRTGFPVDAFRQAMIRAAKGVGLYMVDAATSGFYFIGEIGIDNRELVEIVGEPTMLESIVSVGQNKKSPRYRAMFKEWSAPLMVEFNMSTIGLQDIVNLLAYAGFHVGIGEGRPERKGSNGRFVISPAWNSVITDLDVDKHPVLKGKS